MQGADMVHDARMYNEILRSYAGIIRIRFMGMISATVARAPLQTFLQMYIIYITFTTCVLLSSCRKYNQLPYLLVKNFYLSLPHPFPKSIAKVQSHNRLT